MALKVNDNASSNGSSKSYYTGLENFKVLCVNPTKSEMQDILNFEVDEETVYTSNKDGVDKVRIVFWLDNDDEGNRIRCRADFFISKQEKVSAGGKYKYCNKYGQFAYLPADGSIPENMNWFRADGMRKAMDGEEELTTFIKNYINHSTKNNEEAQLDITSYLKGDVSELKSVISDNKVRVCLGIRQYTSQEGNIGYQQTVYTRTATRPYDKEANRLIEDIKQYKANGGGSTIYFGEGNYTLNKVDNPESISFFSADDPKDLVAPAAF